MSRMASLWTAGAVALLFALVVGAVLLRPVLSVNADTPDANRQVNVTTAPRDEPLSTGVVQIWQTDDDGGQWTGENEHHNEFDDDHSSEHEDDD